MADSQWLAALASFVGAGLAYLGAWRGSRQREHQGRREEWGRRFTSALDAIKSDDLRSRMLGRTLLAELATSELAGAEERSLAEALLTEEARYDPHGTDLRLVAPGPELDGTRFIEDDEV
ncbi:MAG: hypothetical protein QOK10_2566, partial [Pseudonocardiales bacterium]|nr:hypothetical protein [Pseudonocardiales bacterium]